LAVSFINFNCRRYVSGVRLQGCDDQIPELSQAGLIITESEEHIDLAPNEIIKLIRVNTIRDGIVGFELHASSGSGKTTKATVLGGSFASDPDCAVAELLPDISSCIRGLAFTFDV
jgi:hypothetical protein